MLAWIPYLLQAVGWVLSLIGASDSLLKRWEKLIQDSYKYGGVPVEIKDEFADQQTDGQKEFNEWKANKDSTDKKPDSPEVR